MKKYILYVLLLCGCASIQSLEGGDKDVQPPQITSQFPDSAAVNVTTNAIELSFDEYVKLQNANNLILISPLQITPPTITNKGKKVTIKLNDTLQSNTTYSIEINGSIVDNNEGNPLNSKIIFSTGTYIDSLTYSGYVINTYSNKPCEECVVQLYSTTSDSNVLLNKPSYISKTKPSGYFQFTNLPSSSFQMIALHDENKNLILERKELTSLYTQIHIDTSTKKPDSLYIFPYLPYEKPNPKLLKQSPPGVITITFTEPLNYKPTLIINNQATPYTTSITNDTITSYYTPTFDTTSIQIITNTDTTQLYIPPPSDKSIPLNISLQSLTTSEIHLKTRHNIGAIDPYKIHLILNNKLIPIDSVYVLNQIIHITSQILIDSQYLLQLDSGFVKNTIGEVNLIDTLILPPISSSTPKLTLDIKTTDTLAKIIQLVSKEHIIQSFKIYKDTIINISTLNPGSFYTRIISDSNNNSIWNTGDPITNTNPEKIQNSESFELRNNWDKELIINIL